MRKRTTGTSPAGPAFLLALSLFAGAAALAAGNMPAEPGRWHRFEQRPSSSPITFKSEEERREIERLEAMGYLPGSQPVKARTGLLRHDRERAYQGLNLYVSGHGPVAHLMDMDGNLLHKWGLSYFDAFPNARPPAHIEVPNHWRRAYLYPNGDLIANYGGWGLVKMDKDSNLIWGINDRIHHDLYVVESGDIYTLVRDGVRIPALNPTRAVVMDYILHLNADGGVLRRISLYDCMRNSDYAAMIEQWRRKGDILHANTIQVLDGRHAKTHPAFKKGNVLVSLRNCDTIAIVAPDEEKVVWALSGLWHRQHEPVLLDSGNMIIFDNLGLRDRSRILEFDPCTEKVLWQYGNRPGEFFLTRLIGSVQRLPNGNTLVSESDNGRVFEVAPEKEIVWEFVSPYLAGPNDEYIASVYELVRVSPDFPHDWADPATTAISITAGQGQN